MLSHSRDGGGIKQVGAVLEPHAQPISPFRHEQTQVVKCGACFFFAKIDIEFGEGGSG